MSYNLKCYNDLLLSWNTHFGGQNSQHEQLIRIYCESAIIPLCFVVDEAWAPFWDKLIMFNQHLIANERTL